MKKSIVLFAVVLFLVIVWGGIVYVVGNNAEKSYLNLLEESSQFGFVTFTNTSYERGFLQFKATTLMQIDFPVVESRQESLSIEQDEMTDEPAVEMTERSFRLEFEHIFYHGPLPVSSGPASRFGSGPAIALVETSLVRFSPEPEGLQNLLEEIPELKRTIDVARIGFDGTTVSILEMPKFEYPLEDGRVTSGGLKAELTYSLVSGALSGSYDIQSVEFSMPEQGSMVWEGLSGEFDLQKVLPLVYVGPSKAVVGAMEINFPSLETGELEVVRIEEMELTSNSSFDGQMVNLQQKSMFGGITIESDKYRPLFIDAEAKNLDAQALSEFQRQVIANYKDTSKLDPDAIAGAILPLYLELFGKLLAGDPEMNIRNFSFVTPKGAAEGIFELKTSGIRDVSFDDPSRLLQYLQHIDSSASLTVDESLVQAIMLSQAKSGINEQVAVAKLLEQGLELSDQQIEEMAVQQYEQQLEMVIAQKYIVREGEKLKTRVTFKQGVLMLNGQMVPLFQGAM